MTIPVQSYKRPARWIHWLMALCIIPMIPAGFIMIQEGIPRALQNTLFLFHKNMGSLLLLLIVVRLLYRWRNPAPAEPAHLPDWQVKVAALTHWLLYALLVVMPLSGYIRVRAGGFPIEALDALGVPALVPRSDQLAAVAKDVHLFAGYAIAGLVAMHIAAALHHAVIKRDGVFSRMWVTPASRARRDAAE
ncbi:cytochrome b [Gymnodinialimonas sp. 2305UL16-5]|uniref:cytochrome b n=1 Tax=Gymnodinialimonas mytili TaxID=3126503 RepID=UPI00309E721F